MKAALCKSLDGPQSLVDRDGAGTGAGPGQAIVRVKAVGLNFADTLITRGKYQFKPDLPFSPGAEIAGVVESVSSAEHRDFAGPTRHGLRQLGRGARKKSPSTPCAHPGPGRGAADRRGRAFRDLRHGDARPSRSRPAEVRRNSRRNGRGRRRRASGHRNRQADGRARHRRRVIGRKVRHRRKLPVPTIRSSFQAPISKPTFAH